MNSFDFDILKSNSLKQSKISNFYEKNILSKILRLFGSYVFPISFLFWIFIFVTNLLSINILGDNIQPIMFLTAIIVAVSGIVLWFYMFINDRLVKVKTSLTIEQAKNLLDQNASFNFAECLDSESGAQLLAKTYLFAKKGGYQTIDPVFLFLALTESEIGRYLFIRLGLNFESVIEENIKPILENLPKNDSIPESTDEFSKILEESLNVALSINQLKGKETINAGDVVVAAFKKSKFFDDILVNLELNVEDISNIVNWYYLQRKFSSNKRAFWDPKTIVSGFADEWAFGFTNTLSRFGINWTSQIAAVLNNIHTYGCSDVISEMESILSRGEKNNVLLVGNQGVGRQPAVNGLIAKMIREETLPELHYKKVYKIDVGALLSGASEKGEVEERITAILNESLYAGNVILFIEEIDSIISSEEHTGTVNASSIILPYLKGSNLQIIATTTLEKFHKDIEANPGVADAFEKIDVKEPSKDVVISVLEDAVPRIEYRNNVVFLYNALKEAINAADKYIHDRSFPAKAIDLVDEVAANVRKTKGQGALVEKSDIDEVISEKINMPVGKVQESEKDKLLNLEEFLHKRVIGQDEAIKVIADAMRRARSGVQSGKRPIGVFLFLGPTGVGKTETAKALAENYFGSEKNMIRLDMSEYQEQTSMNRMIGAPPEAGSEGTQGQLTKAVKDNPFSLLLLDEIEKANPDILNLFLQVFDDGRLTDGKGETIDFTNSIIIATSNAGSEIIREQIKQGSVSEETFKEKLLNELQSKGIFRPEFLNRFDAIVAYKPLSKDQLNLIIKLMIESLNKTLSDKEVKVELSPDAISKVIDIGFDPEFGARPLRRALQDKVENLVAKKLLEGDLQKGQTLVIKGEDIK